MPAEQRTLGRFRLLHQLGQGAMATLYLAVDEMGRLLAIKRLHARLAGEARFVDAFCREAELAGRIRHPNVCAVMSVERAAGELFIVMEYVHGETVADLIQGLRRAGGTLSQGMVLHLAGQACLGLQAAHELRDPDGRHLALVHRDIGPRNLMVTYDGQLKIVDFGIAAVAQDSAGAGPGGALGTPAYLSPEQARGQTPDGRADLFSLALVLHELLSLDRCFTGDDPRAVVRTIAALKQPPAAPRRADLSPELLRLLHRALRPLPEQRYPSAARMYGDLYRLLLAHPGGMTAQRLGQMMRRVFADRFPLREELRALAFSDPDVLEEEELSLETRPTHAPAGIRCDYCGAALSDRAQLKAHLKTCDQWQWYEYNFAQNKRNLAVSDVEALRRQAREGLDPEPGPGLWQRLRAKLSREKPDPLAVRLQATQTQLATVRQPQAAEAGRRAVDAIADMVLQISEKTPTAQRLLGRLKPRLMRCANLVVGLAVEIDSNAAYLVAVPRNQSQRQLETLLARLETAQQQDADPELIHELESTSRRKRALLAECDQTVKRNERLLLRLDSMVDAVELTHGRVLQISASPVVVEAEATTQITVFLDALLLEVEQLAQSVREVE